MSTGTVLTNNRTQTVLLPADMHFPEKVKKVTVRAMGLERIIAPAENTWDSFFLGDQSVSEDFMNERPEQYQRDRE